jgi:hypothetical protein
VWIEQGTPSVRIRVFVSSPGDMPKERRLIAEICRELSLTMPAHVEALLWEGAGSRNPEVQPFPPEITGYGAQAVIDDHIWNRLGGYDVYLGMLWRRIGTPTGAWRSGTEAEFRYAYDRFSRGEIPRKILFYEKGAKYSDSQVRERKIRAHAACARAVGFSPARTRWRSSLVNRHSNGVATAL